MTVRTLALAAALTFGVGSAAMAQTVVIEADYYGPRYERPWVGPVGPVEGAIGGALALAAPYGGYYSDYNTGYRWGRSKRGQDSYLDEYGYNSYRPHAG